MFSDFVWLEFKLFQDSACVVKNSTETSPEVSSGSMSSPGSTSARSA